MAKKNDQLVIIDTVTIKSVKVDQVKRHIAVSIEFSLNGDNFESSGQMAFWAFNEQPIKLTAESLQLSFGLLDEKLMREDNSKG